MLSLRACASEGALKVMNTHDFGHRRGKHPPEVGLAHEHRAVRPAGGRASRRQAGHLDHRTVRVGPEAASRVLVSNVAGPVMAKTLTRLTKKVFRVNLEFVTAAQEYHGLTNGYLDTSLLGSRPMAGPDRRLDPGALGALRGGRRHRGQGRQRGCRRPASGRPDRCPASI